MRRVALTDGSGRWFDIDAAERFEEATDWDGRNRVSRATGTWWCHEELYRTKSGQWIRHWWSQQQGTLPRWELLSEDEAARWLIQNDYDPAECGIGEYASRLEV